MTEEQEAKLRKRFKRLFNYVPDTGELLRRVGVKGGSKVGTNAGTRQPRAIIVRVDGHNYQAHKIIWLLMTGHWPQYPAEEVDHIDRNPFNNRWSNLRLGTRQQNSWNMHSHMFSSNLLKGVTRTKSGRYQAQIGVNRSNIYLGTFDTPEEAHEAYKVAALKHFGEFASFQNRVEAP